ncbi:MAG: O-antigen ligase family protein [Methyloversatilis sp.]|jgi:hypothetical protein|nr:O-antigen ligase family protein [Methyloversatilis sp.]MBP6193783.1 O-antigen ligase family protein [Methyloversatilis sp.]MBP9117566.1 O-antigen ligase family protein [Methyloversatilis sp.]
MTATPSRSIPGWLFPALLFLLCGAIALPMLPVWQGAVRLLAGLALICVLTGRPGTRRTIAAALAACALISSAGWIAGLAAAPVSHVIHALTDVFGQPLGLLPDFSLLLYDALCVTGLMLFLLRRDRQAGLPHVAFVAALGIFWWWGVLTVASSGADALSEADLSQMATGLSGWATWVYWAVLTLLLVRDETQLQQALKALGIGGLIVGAVIALQWMSADFSYVIAAVPGTSEGFHRVRGTDYYHAPAACIVGLTAFAFLGLTGARQRVGAWLAAAALIGLTILNNTRAVSLALMSGLAVLFVTSLWRRQWYVAVMSLFAVALVAPHLLYLKPTLTNAPPQALSTSAKDHPTDAGASDNVGAWTSFEPTIADQPTSGTKPQSASVAEVANANTSRSALAENGLAILPDAWLYGHGVGTLDLPLEGNSFSGLTSTYSTHTLYLDIALMAGIPALIAALVVFASGTFGALQALFGSKSSPSRAGSAAALIAMLTMFAVLSLFLPQERNEVIGIAFAVAALALVAAGRSSPEATCPVRPRVGAWVPGYVLIALGAAGWAILTSPTYIFPALELVGRHGNEIVRERQQVYVNEPAMRPVLASLLRLRGGDAAQVSVLPDSSQALEARQAWIVWNPGRLTAYPVLASELGKPRHPHRNQALAISMPAHWWLMPSAQPTASFLFAGARLELPAGGLHRTVDDASLQVPVLPNHAPFANILLAPNIGGQAEHVADFNNGSSVSWNAARSAEIRFHVPAMAQQSLRAYRMTALHIRSMQKADRYTWTMEGSADGQVWTRIDSRNRERVSQDISMPSTYLIPDAPAFPFYRIRFMPTEDVPGAYAGISEMELYFSPDSRLTD